jgi:hypothetical protein
MDDQTTSSLKSDMLNRFLGKQDLSLPALARQTSLKRGLDDIVKQESSIDKKPEANDLEPLESLPAQSKRNKPNEKRAASIDRATRRGRDSTSNRQTKEVKAPKTISREQPNIIGKHTRC